MKSAVSVAMLEALAAQARLLAEKAVALAANAKNIDIEPSTHETIVKAAAVHARALTELARVESDMARPVLLESVRARRERSGR